MGRSVLRTFSRPPGLESPHTALVCAAYRPTCDEIGDVVCSGVCVCVCVCVDCSVCVCLSVFVLQALSVSLFPVCPCAIHSDALYRVVLCVPLPVRCVHYGDQLPQRSKGELLPYNDNLTY
jgi:hypothetical protein